MRSPKTCFFSYSSSHREVKESIELAIDQINTTDLVVIQGIGALSVAGKTVFGAIQKVIDDSELFMCDLTEFSPEILFELGYAIAKNKPIWITLNSSYPQTQKSYHKIGPLAEIGCSTYENFHELVSKFFSGRPFDNLESTVYNDVIQSLVQMRSKPPTLFYLQSAVRTDASLRLTRRLQSVPTVVDDPLEVISQPLSWYAQNAYYAYALIVHFIDRERESSAISLQNAKYWLVAGLTHGFGKPILMLAHAPFQSPVDYQHLLRTHETAAECIAIVDSWLPTVESCHLVQEQRHKAQQKELQRVVGLHRINLGEYVAENEAGSLAEYFVITAPFEEALRTTQYKIYVGRKGSGKTANLQQLEERIQQDKRNYVCVIRPVDYEFEGALNLLTSSLSKADSGYLIQSLWKFLIYTELALSMCKWLQARSPHLGYDKAESELIQYMDQNEDLRQDFTVRMEYAIQDLCNIDFSENVRSGRIRVSEILHNRILTRLHEYIGNVLRDKNRVYILIDNLDKAWRKREDLDTLAAFLFGLLGASQDISDQLQRGGLRRPQVNLALVIFLRSDIFSYIMTTAREGDKLAFAKMDWTDPILLRRVIEERFIASLGEKLAPQEVWEQFFSISVKGMATKDYIVQRIIPRPRDIIFLCKSALSQAINHKHTRIEEEDILEAEKEYSELAVNSLTAEIETQLDRAEEFLYEFVGQSDIVTRDEIVGFLANAGISVDEADTAIELLCDNTFLGLETAPNTFKFMHESGRKGVFKKLAQNEAKRRRQERFKIGAPFHSFLEIVPSGGIEVVPLGSEHPNIRILVERMNSALERQDYSEVLHTSASVFETMAKDVVSLDSVQDQTLGSFFEKYRKESLLPDEVLDYIIEVYKARNKAPLAGHGSTRAPSISREVAITLAEMTQAFVRIEYRLGKESE